MRAALMDKIVRENTYSFNDAQVIGMVRFSLFTGIVCGSIVAFFFASIL